MNKVAKLTFRMTSEDVEDIDDFLQLHGIKKRSPFLREAIMSYIGSAKPVLRRKTFEELREWRKELHNVGVNLNQTAYRLNADHPLGSSQITEVLNELQKQFGTLADRFWRLEDELR